MCDWIFPLYSFYLGVVDYFFLKKLGLASYYKYKLLMMVNILGAT